MPEANQLPTLRKSGAVVATHTSCPQLQVETAAIVVACRFSMDMSAAFQEFGGLQHTQ